jgi:hypothetical protein
VAPHEIQLELPELLPRDDDVRELPETRVDALDEGVLGFGWVYAASRRVDADCRARREDRRCLAEGNGRQIF